MPLVAVALPLGLGTRIDVRGLGGNEGAQGRGQGGGC
jgi:hypothetical protein